MTADREQLKVVGSSPTGDASQLHCVAVAQSVEHQLPARILHESLLCTLFIIYVWWWFTFVLGLANWLS